MMSRFSRFVVARETLLANRWLKPFAHRLAHPTLWHLNRRSVARGVALGLFCAFALPFGRIPAATLVALKLRANVTVAALASLVANPLTLPPIYFAAYRVGRRILGVGGTRELSEAQIAAVADQATKTMQHSDWTLLNILLPLALGLLILALAFSLSGYVLAQQFWTMRTRSRWRRRRENMGVSRSGHR